MNEQRGLWPAGVSDGLSLACADCGAVPRFDYRVAGEFWRQWVPGPERRGVVCLPCLDGRCGGVGLAGALEEVQWTGTGHTVVLRPELRHVYSPRHPSATEERGLWLGPILLLWLSIVVVVVVLVVLGAIW